MLPRKEQKCANCTGFLPAEREGEPGLCAGGRPTLILVGVQQHPLDPQLKRPLFEGFFPPVTANKWCREWEHNEDVQAACG